MSSVIDDEVNAAVSNTIGDLVLTPTIKDSQFPNQWPTTAELLALNKRVIIGSGNPFGGQYFLSWDSWPGYPHNQVTHIL